MYQWYIIHPDFNITPIGQRHHQYFEVHRALVNEGIAVKHLVKEDTVVRWRKILEAFHQTQQFGIDFAGEIHPIHQEYVGAREIYDVLDRATLVRWMDTIETFENSHDQVIAD